MPGADDQLAELAEWMRTADARRAAARALQRLGLRIDADDLCSQTYLRIARRVRRLGPVELEAGKTIAGYAAKAMGNVAKDMLRGTKRDALGHVAAPLDDGDDLVEQLGDPVAPDVDAAVIGELGGRETIDGLRMHLLDGSDGEVWPTSAALSFVTLVVDPARDDQLGPRPDAGAEGQWRYWSALWLAGRSDVLPDGTRETKKDDPARRKRRERAMTRIRDRLRAAHAAVGVGSEAP